MKHRIGRKVFSSLAHAITLTNLVLGVTALVLVWNGRHPTALGLICLAALMDGLDGKVARCLRSESSLGRELDSLCDLVSFGVAPAFLACAHLLRPHPLWAAILIGIFVACGAFRLARFNTAVNPSFFMGVPITAAGVILALASVLFPGLLPLPLTVIMLILSVLMVSKIRIPKL